MRRSLLHGLVTGCMVVGGLAIAGSIAAAQDPTPQPKPAQQEAPKVDVKAIWPAGLEKISGRYVFAQVASPGGLWERGGETPRQIALPDCPPELQKLLRKAEIIISDLKKPTEIHAEERLSPTKRGMLRFYREHGAGKLTIRNLPGIGAVAGDGGNFNGVVEFYIDHQGHSNPSVNGVLEQRKRQEQTWGAAAIDFADLEARIPEPDDAGNDKGAKEGEADEKPEKPDHPPVIGNARILRSGVEIFAFLEWEGEGPRGKRTYQGAIRMAKVNSDAPSAKPGKTNEARAKRSLLSALNKG